MSILSTQIHVFLLDEGVDVWRPVKAIHVERNVYRIEDTIPDGEKWEFQPGQLVECENRTFESGETRLTAIREAKIPPKT